MSDFPEHEGYPIGFVVRDGCSLESGLFRELEYPRDNRDCRPDLISAGCDCGWRSPRFRPERDTKWGPFSVFATEPDDERVRQLFADHLRGVHAAKVRGAA